MRGEEILSGAQRIHEAPLLIEKMKEKGIDPASMSYYVDAFKERRNVVVRETHRPTSLEPQVWPAYGRHSESVNHFIAKRY